MNVCVRCRLVPLVNTNDKHIAWLLFGDLLGGPIREVDLLAETYPRQGPQISTVVTPNGRQKLKFRQFEVMHFFNKNLIFS